VDNGREKVINLSKGRRRMMEVSQKTAQSVRSQAIWSPTAVALFCFFFTFLAAGLMNAISYGRVGFANKRNKRLLIVIPGFIAFLFLAMVTPDGLSPLFTVFNLAMILYFRQDQKKLYDLHVGRGGDKA